MNCIVTAGPTYEELDQVRRLTNFSTGRLGSQLADHLVECGHAVTLLLGHYATWRGTQRAQAVQRFTTTADLRERLQSLAARPFDAVFHAAAVSDFTFGKVFERAADGTLTECRSDKFSTRTGTLLAELVPTAKLIGELRGWFPGAFITGWKYEVEGDCYAALKKAGEQITAQRTDACVANGPAYGFGFGLVTRAGEQKHFSDTAALFAALERMARA